MKVKAIWLRLPDNAYIEWYITHFNIANRRVKLECICLWIVDYYTMRPNENKVVRLRPQVLVFKIYQN